MIRTIGTLSNSLQIIAFFRHLLTYLTNQSTTRSLSEKETMVNSISFVSTAKFAE